MLRNGKPRILLANRVDSVALIARLVSIVNAMRFWPLNQVNWIGIVKKLLSNKPSHLWSSKD